MHYHSLFTYWAFPREEHRTYPFDQDLSKKDLGGILWWHVLLDPHSPDRDAHAVHIPSTGLPQDHLKHFQRANPVTVAMQLSTEAVHQPEEKRKRID